MEFQTFQDNMHSNEINELEGLQRQLAVMEARFKSLQDPREARPGPHPSTGKRKAEEMVNVDLSQIGDQRESDSSGEEENEDSRVGVGF